MITISVQNKPIFDMRSDAYVFFVEENFTFSKELEQFSGRYFPQLRVMMQAREFTGKALATLVVPVSLEDRTAYLMFVGLGNKESNHYELELLRRVVGQMIRMGEANKVSSLALHMPPATWFGSTVQELAKQLAVTMHMASYHFDLFFTDASSKLSRDMTVTLLAPEHEHEAITTGITQGGWIAESINAARTWVDMPPSMLHPEEFATFAREIAKKHNLKITVFNEQQINEMGMGGLAGVSRGSDRDAQFIVTEYRTAKKDAPTLAFVGKGITFDSGGLSIKPAAYMEDMKEDMAGAAAVIASMDAIAKLKPEVNIIALTPICENLPSGKATKPGDILRFYNGKTAEVRNTDAEGRLILADALSYAVQHYQPDFMIDLATLTGACAHALGPFYSGMMSKHDDMVKKVEHASALSGDRVWRLPFHDDYKVAIKSAVADICNIGNPAYKAGSITAGFFLSNFVGDTPWVHLDIAGTAFDVPDMPYYRKGSATGVGVRLLVELAMHWQK